MAFAFQWSDGWGGNNTSSTSTSGTSSRPNDSSDTKQADLPDSDTPVDEELGRLNWEYICSAHIPAGNQEYRVTGLENGKNYVFQLVAYDRAGNVAPAGGSVKGQPVETTNFWDACANDPEQRCGKNGFCSLQSADPFEGGAFGILALVGAGLILRKRRQS